jgi:hypothetical protein
MTQNSLIAILIVPVLASCRSANEHKPEPPAPWLLESVLARMDDRFDDPAQLVPADIRLFLQVARSGAILDNEKDPLVAEAWQLIEETLPEHVWSRAAEKLGLERREFVRDVFGQHLTLVELKERGQRRAVVFSRPSAGRIADLPDALDLLPWDEQKRIGPWSLYRGDTGEGEYMVALGSRWLAITGIDGSDHLRRILVTRASGEPSLVDDDEFRRLLERLPSTADAMLYTRSSSGKDRHAISLRYQGDALQAHYAARADRAARYVDPLDSIPRAEFGPLPDDVVVAGTVSMITREIPGESFLDLMLFPRDFRAGVLPSLRPPLVFFLGKVERDRFTPDPGFTVPVAGVAVRLRDLEVAGLLDRLCSRIHFFLSISRLDLIEGFLGVRSVERGDLEYHVADFGPVILSSGGGPILEKLAALPQAKLLTQLAYGRIGDYYVVCNQEEFLHTWNESRSGRAARFEDATDFGRFDLGDHQGLIASVVTRGQELAILLDGLTGFIREALGDEAVDELAGEREQERIEREEKERLEQPLRWLGSGFQNRRVVSVQIWRDEEESLLLGRLVALP